MTHYNFENQSLTVAEIQLLVPILSDRTIRRHLAAGRCTREAMLSYNPKAKYREAGKRSAKSGSSRGWGFA